ncbi:hypothetical protein NLX83_33875 [Allokutzneria sp. A3M-2-11 16]|uniref:hypothetical protein n=1 Tax=Allokutzneria sp. A3M-2-11 16 TaxID=2962043 RepID=UPI0020B89959|nr:hypothetical protein [Allokutzneria sp. A3M-2-11 16]MCP3804271.1 hypothetical protein [Allokutzneria sp. A3M-2-11 16]
MAKRRIGGAGGGSDPGTKAPAAVAIAAAGALVIGSGMGAGGVSTLGSAAESAALRNISAKKADGTKAAKSGNARQAWQRMGLRELKKHAKSELNCLLNSFGEIRGFFARTPCKSLERNIFAIGDDEGNVAVVSVVWVRFHARSHAESFEKLHKVHGNGDVKPLASSLLDLADIRFTAHHYGSRRNGSTVTIAEAESAKGKVGGEALDVLAEVSSYLP